MEHWMHVCTMTHGMGEKSAERKNEILWQDLEW